MCSCGRQMTTEERLSFLRAQLTCATHDMNRHAAEIARLEKRMIDETDKDARRLVEAALVSA